MSDLIQGRVDLARQKKELKRKLSDVEKQIAEADALILKKFQADGVRSLQTEDGARVGLAAALRSTMKEGVSSASIAEELASSGHCELLMGSASTIKSLVKERIDEWELENGKEFDGDWNDVVPELADLYDFDQTPVVRVTGA